MCIKIRSNAHPVPELAQDGDWFEVPFWVWLEKEPLRRGLYMRRLGKRIVLSNQHDWELKIDSAEPLDQLKNLSADGIAIRPRALMTTMYSRMVLSDLFVHGIGGAKYDQLTDAIIARFWNVTPPEFLTVTGTATLPFDFDPVVPADVTAQEVRLRELRFHPERFIDLDLDQGNEAARAIVQKKKKWIKRTVGKPDSGILEQRHDAITRCNRELTRYVAEHIDRATADRDQKKQQLARSQILSSREYSFCCFSKERCELPFYEG